jgi:hypothetical protein
MLVYIDDSGDPGFKFDRGSSTHFVLALVCFATDADAARTAVQIRRLQDALGFSRRTEFKFNGSSRPVRERFLQTVATAPFSICSMVIDKPRTADPHPRSGKGAFYDFAVREAVRRHRDVLADARVWIDGRAERAYRLRLRNDLRRIARVQDIRLVRSQAEPLIQMADRIAGATRLSHVQGRTDAAVYKALIADYIVEEWVIPA